MLQSRIKGALLPPQATSTKLSLPFKSTTDILKLGENHSGPTVTSDYAQFGRVQTMHCSAGSTSHQDTANEANNAPATMSVTHSS
jgi:hypothetical protein